MEFKNILVFRVGHLGDTIVALPALWAVRKAFPSARLTLLTNTDAKNPNYISSRNVLPSTGLFDDWMAYPSNLGPVRSAAAYAKLALALRSCGFDALFYLMTRNRTVSQIDRDLGFFRKAGIRNVLGSEYLRQNTLGAVLEKPTPSVESEGEFLLRCLEFDGIKVDRGSVFPDMGLTVAEIGTATKWLENETDHRGRRLIGIAPGSKWESKIWPEQHFEHVVGRLVDAFDVFPIVFGGPEDREVGERLTRSWETGANAAGILGIREATALLGKCDLYLGNDTGTMHMAAAAGTPCVAIFAAIDAIGRWNPFGDRNVVFRRSVECEGCQAPVCFNSHKCLELVSPDEIHRACERLLIASGAS